MTDIVERLLDPKYCGQEGMRSEAADTITKLRAEVAELRKQLEPKITPALEPSFDDDDAALGEGEK